MAQRVLTAKLPEELVVALDAVASGRDTSRNAVVREALEALVEGRISALTPEATTARRISRSLERDYQLTVARVD